MTYIIWVALIVLFIILIYALYILARNNKVYRFRIEITDMLAEWDRNHLGEESSFYWFYDKLPSYTEMLYSRKKLKLENFASEDMINKLYDYDEKASSEEYSEET